jgi:circadian clock protein KaiC
MRSQETRRLVLDGVDRMAAPGAPPEELQRLFQALAARLKSRGVTGLFTLDAESMHSDEPGTERGYAPLADNLLMMRYAHVAGELRPTISVVKTRGSANERSAHYLATAKGGLKVGDRVNGCNGRPRKTRGVDPDAET